MNEPFPPWLIYGPLVVAMTAALSLSLLAWGVAGWIRPRVPDGAPWYVHARAATLAHLRLGGLLLVSALAIAGALFSTLASVSFLPIPLEREVFVALCLLGWLFVQARVHAACSPRPLSFGRALRDRVAWLLVTGAGWVWMPFVVFAMPADLGVAAVVALAAAEDAGLLLAIPRLLGLARPAGTRVPTAGFRSVDVLDCTSASTHVFSPEGRLVVTTGLLDALTADELAAILAWQSRLVATPTHVLRARRALTVALAVAVCLVKPLVTAFFGSAVLYGAGVWWLWKRRGELNRQMLDAADQAGAPDTARLTQALVTLHRSNALSPDLEVLGGHRSLTDRVVALGQTPDWAPPEATDRRMASKIQVAGMVVAAAVFLIAPRLPGLPEDPRVRLAIGQGRTPEVLALAAELREQRRVDAAADVYAAGARALSESAWARPRLEVLALTAQGHCGAAESAWAAVSDDGPFLAERDGREVAELDDEVEGWLASCEKDAAI